MLDTVCHFAIDRLDGSSEASVVRDRHRDHFLELAEKASMELAGADAARWLDRLTHEHDNLMRAIAWCDGPGGSECALRFVAALRRYWSSRGLLSLGRELARRALDRPGARGHRQLMVHAHSSVAQLCWWLGEPAVGLPHGRVALDIATEIGDIARQSGANRVLSYLCGAMGDLAAAGKHAQASLELARRLGDRFAICDSLVAVADFHYESGELAKAEALYREVLSVRHELEHREGEGLAAVSLTEVAIQRREPAAAGDWLRRALALVTQTHSRYLGQHVIEQAAALASLTADWSACLRWFAASAMQRKTTQLSDATTSQRQRSTAMAAASGALGNHLRDQAEAGGRALGYEETLTEIEAWLARAAPRGD
jgi:non-specific serine/threonine protein kinase